MELCIPSAMKPSSSWRTSPSPHPRLLERQVRRVNKEFLRQITRRHFFGRAGAGIGAIALWNVLADTTPAGDVFPASNPLRPKPPHHPAKARSVISLGQIGAPSQLDLFDYKPELVKMDGQPVPESVLKGEKFVFIGEGKTQVLASPWQWFQHGTNGTWLTDQLPHHRAIVDDITFIHTMHTNEMNHVPATLLLQSGSPRMGRPAMGAWVTYGLGTENRNLP